MLYTIVLKYDVTNKHGNNLRSRVRNLQIEASSEEEALDRAMALLELEDDAIVSRQANVFDWTEIQVSPPL